MSVLVATSNEANGVNCANGGKKISAGADANVNGILDSAEVTSSGYLCNGLNGTNGSNGVTGNQGAAGLNSLLVNAPESAGANCAFGGNKVTSGLDSNANSSLDLNEITATSYVCNGQPGPVGAAGPGIAWVNVVSTNQQALNNTGYLANNTAQVTITLPVNPNIGDLVQVSGVGAGGWKIAQNDGQSIQGKYMNDSDANIGALWLPREGSRSWRQVASSSDGSKLVAMVVNGLIYTSADSGQTWTPRESARYWYSVASSSDGSKLVAVVASGQIYTSTNHGTTPGTTGFISGNQYETITLQYIGNNIFTVWNNPGTYVVR